MRIKFKNGPTDAESMVAEAAWAELRGLNVG